MNEPMTIRNVRLLSVSDKDPNGDPYTAEALRALASSIPGTVWEGRVVERAWFTGDELFADIERGEVQGFTRHVAPESAY